MRFAASCFEVRKREKEGQEAKSRGVTGAMERHFRTCPADVATDHPYRNTVSAIPPDGYGQKEIWIPRNTRDYKKLWKR